MSSSFISDIFKFKNNPKFLLMQEQQYISEVYLAGQLFCFKIDTIMAKFI